MWKSRAEKPRWQQPIVFGPLPGVGTISSDPSLERSLFQPTKARVTILFKTSATLIRNLFPNSRYYFDKMDTVVQASFCLDSLRNLAWLGGNGYDSLGLYIHGVCYKTRDGQVRKGTYCPILFENLAESIVTGREELGLPKVFSEILVTRESTSYRAKVSWNGAQWGALELTGLQASEKDSAEVDRCEGLLVHKYIPSAEVEKPDVEYDLLHLPDSNQAIKSLQVADVSNSRFGIHDLGQGALPSLHQVVSRLAEIPIFEVTGASVKEYEGVQERPNIERLS